LPVYAKYGSDNINGFLPFKQAVYPRRQPQAQFIVASVVEFEV
jgi:hypothetical protein